MAELDCGHNQHVRHKPPMQWREWVLDPETRAARVGTALACPMCDRAELPEPLRLVRREEWDEQSLPLVTAGEGWVRIVLLQGRLRVGMATSPPLDVVMEPGSVQAVPPGVEYAIDPDGPVRVAVQYLIVSRADPDERAEAGGDPACWAALVCPECGGVAGDGSGHRPECSATLGGFA